MKAASGLAAAKTEFHSFTGLTALAGAFFAVLFLPLMARAFRRLSFFPGLMMMGLEWLAVYLLLGGFVGFFAGLLGVHDLRFLFHGLWVIWSIPSCGAMTRKTS